MTAEVAFGVRTDLMGKHTLPCRLELGRTAGKVDMGLRSDGEQMEWVGGRKGKVIRDEGMWGPGRGRSGL